MALLILVASITLQLAAVVVALRLIRVTGRAAAWVAIASAVTLMAVRRIVTLVSLVRHPASPPWDLLSVELIALLISALILVGLAAIGPTIEQLRRTDELAEGFGRVVESSLSEVYIFAADDLRFLRVNRGARANLGYSDHELRRLTPLDLKPEFDPTRFRTLLARLTSGQTPRTRFEPGTAARTGRLTRWTWTSSPPASPAATPSSR